MKTRNKYYILLTGFLLSILLTPLFGKIYEVIIGRKITSWIGSNPGYIEGFFLSYCFFLTLSIFVLFDGKERKKIYLFFIAPVLFLNVLIFNIENLLINLIEILLLILVIAGIKYLVLKTSKPQVETTNRP